MEIVKKFGLLIIVILGLLFTSCEGYRISDGVVKENSTDVPLDSVLCKVTDGGDEMLTDSTGKFSVTGPFGGCMFGCKDIVVEFSKSGYKTRTLMNDESDGTIYLEKE